MNKLQNVQALRGVAVLAVVFFHLIIIERRYGGVDTILPDWLAFGMFGVDLFFVISGFVMVTVTQGKFQNLRQALLFFISSRLADLSVVLGLYHAGVAGVSDHAGLG